MTEATQSDNPNDIDSLSTLKIKAVSGNLSPSIYANGRNQLPIQITVKAVNKAGNPLKFSNETWISILNLRFAESDKKLNRKGSSGWCFTEVENEYSKEIQPGSHRSKRFLSDEDGKAIIILYVYTDDTNTKRIAVSVDTDNGKHFTTADSPSGAEEMSVTINAFQALNYADRANLSIESGDFVTLSSNLGWSSRQDALNTAGQATGFGVGLALGPLGWAFGSYIGSKTPPIYKEHYNGICERRLIKIYPNNSQRKFKKYEITYNPISNEEVKTGNFLWNGEETDGFTLRQSDSSYPCAVIGRWGTRENYQINLWFSRKNGINIDGHLFLEDTFYYYRFCPCVKEDHFNDADEGVPTLLLYRFTAPVNNASQCCWRNVIHPVTVNVTDFYGNTSTFQLTFNDTDHSDIPGIV